MGTSPSKHMIESALDMYITMSQKDRKDLQDKLLSSDLRNGRKRVMSMIMNL